MEVVARNDGPDVSKNSCLSTVQPSFKSIQNNFIFNCYLTWNPSQGIDTPSAFKQHPSSSEVCVDMWWIVAANGCWMAAGWLPDGCRMAACLLLVVWSRLFPIECKEIGTSIRPVGCNKQPIASTTTSWQRLLLAVNVIFRVTVEDGRAGA